MGPLHMRSHNRLPPQNPHIPRLANQAQSVAAHCHALGRHASTTGCLRSAKWLFETSFVVVEHAMTSLNSRFAYCINLEPQPRHRKAEAKLQSTNSWNQSQGRRIWSRTCSSPILTSTMEKFLDYQCLKLHLHESVRKHPSKSVGKTKRTETGKNDLKWQPL